VHTWCAGADWVQLAQIEARCCKEDNEHLGLITGRHFLTTYETTSLSRTVLRGDVVDVGRTTMSLNCGQ
jgi:hypothetical protein